MLQVLLVLLLLGLDLREPVERHGARGEGATRGPWLVGVLRGLRVEKLARVPYLCQAAAGAEGAARFSVLDTAVFVLGFEQ